MAPVRRRCGGVVADRGGGDDRVGAAAVWRSRGGGSRVDGVEARHGYVKVVVRGPAPVEMRKEVKKKVKENLSE
jgi:hypothetical protein